MVKSLESVRARFKYMRDYCAVRNWDLNELTKAQGEEIKNTKDYKQLTKQINDEKHKQSIV